MESTIELSVFKKEIHFIKRNINNYKDGFIL